ncbi:hypothetical protein B0H16DRAFT_1479749 [Mycena metata]|uniref:Uncharacterized protein n=1 Tax=Mycena metata TaxID=1033252 RepID=A0AAD7H4L0_9AGAR|nr:hypothetical protein B0H16DRAFT_1479749 [Mycena metata]
MSPPPALSHRTPESTEAQRECAEITRKWHERDRRRVRSYAEFLHSRRLMEGRLACSIAISNMRVAAGWPVLYDIWQMQAETETFGWSVVAPRRSECEILADSWTNGGWGEEHAGWVAWQNPPRPPGVRDPDWDGVTPTPKTPGKKRRQRQRMRERAAALLLTKAQFAEDVRRQAQAAHQKYERESAEARRHWWLDAVKRQLGDTLVVNLPLVVFFVLVSAKVIRPTSLCCTTRGSVAVPRGALPSPPLSAPRANAPSVLALSLVAPRDFCAVSGGPRRRNIALWGTATLW